MLKFELVVCVYKNDSPKYLRECLSSVCESTILPERIIVVEDGPISLDLGRALDDFNNIVTIKRFSLNVNKGFVNALNYALSNSKADYIFRLDPDDVVEPLRFEKSMDIFKNNDSDLVATNGWVIDSESNVKHQYMTNLTSIYKRNPIFHSSVAYKRSFIEKHAGYRNVVSFEDYDLWLRAIKSGDIISVINEPLIRFRQDDNFTNRRLGYQYMLKEYSALRLFISESLIPYSVIPLWILRLMSRMLSGSIVLLLRNLFKI